MVSREHPQVHLASPADGEHNVAVTVGRRFFAGLCLRRPVRFPAKG